MNRVKVVRGIISELANVDDADNETKEEVYDRELSKIRNLKTNGILDDVVQAVGSDKKRQRYAAFIFAELHDVAGIEKVFAELLSSSDPDVRSSIIQSIGLRRMTSLVGALNSHFEHETDQFCRDRLLHALAKIADESSLPIFLHLSTSLTNDHYLWVLCIAAINYRREEFRHFLNYIYSSPEKSKSIKIMAAWGLAKLGNLSAYDYLIQMLDDPVTIIHADGVTTSDPGESLRAAQAIADINNWPFEWGSAEIAKIKRLVGDS